MLVFYAEIVLALLLIFDLHVQYMSRLSKLPNITTTFQMDLDDWKACLMITLLDIYLAGKQLCRQATTGVAKPCSIHMNYYDVSTDACYCCTCPDSACYASARASLCEERKVLANTVNPLIARFSRTPEAATDIVNAIHNSGKLSIIIKARDFDAPFRRFSKVLQEKLKEFMAHKSSTSELKHACRQMLDEYTRLSKPSQILPCKSSLLQN